jgi:hypothetical protein
MPRIRLTSRRGANTVKTAGVGVGALLVLAGVTFGLQGLGLIGGSSMSGKTSWAVIGPLIALVGVALVVGGLRGGTAKPPAVDDSSRSNVTPED